MKTATGNLGFEWSYRDLLMALLVVYMAMAVLALVAVAQTKATEAALSPGNVMVQLWWPPEVDADLDLWVQGPGDAPVGYSNKSTRTFSLLKDDLGRGSEPEARNYELAVGRGTAAGEYTVNVHLYHSRDRKLPVDGKVTVTVQVGGSPREIASERFVMTRVGQEITVLRFSLGDQGDLVLGSIGRLFKPLREAKKT